MADGLTLPGFEAAAGARVALVTEARSLTGAEMARMAEAHLETWRRHRARAVALQAEASPGTLAAWVAAARSGTPLVLLAPYPTDDVLAAVTAAAAPDLKVSAAGIEAWPAVARRVELPPGTVVIATSGTGGPPKIVQHTWASLARPVRVRAELEGSVWLLTYPYHLYAGLQVVLHAWLNGGTLVTLPESRDPEAIVALAERAGVTHVSATPSFLRRLLMLPERGRLRALKLAQITLGGERVTQPVLDALRETFPAARLTHIYATTELGRCFAVEDGREGFPLGLLEGGTKDGVRLRVRDGELQVRPVHGMVRYLHEGRPPAEGEGWVATGDLVEMAGDRVRFRGRLSDLINVGGSKVDPMRVEEVLRRAPHVRDVRVYGRSSALVGQLVAADVVLEGASEDEGRAEIARLAGDQLAEAERPRFLKFVERIELSEAGKVTRQVR